MRWQGSELEANQDEARQKIVNWINGERKPSSADWIELMEACCSTRVFMLINAIVHMSAYLNLWPVMPVCSNQQDIMRL